MTTFKTYKAKMQFITDAGINYSAGEQITQYEYNTLTIAERMFFDEVQEKEKGSVFTESPSEL